jgi:hypothetical protein
MACSGEEEHRTPTRLAWLPVGETSGEALSHLLEEQSGEAVAVNILSVVDDDTAQISAA